MAPAYAVSDMLKQADLRLQDFDFYEIHEAFASPGDCDVESLAVGGILSPAKLGRNEADGPDRPFEA